MAEEDVFQENYITYFTLTTSVKGVSRITKSNQKFLRTMWLVAVLGFLAVSISQVYFLLQEYMDYDSTTNFEETAVTYETSFKFRLPQLTVCSLSPLSSYAQDIAEQHSIPNVIAFSERIRELRKCQGCTEEEHGIINKTLDRNKTPEGYYQFIGRKNSEKLSHLEQSMFAECKVIVFSGHSLLHLPCGKAVSFEPWFSPKYFNCFTANIDKTYFPLPVSGLSLILYADEHGPMVTSDSISMGRKSGFIVALDHNHEVPFSSKRTLITELNKYLHLEISQVTTNRLSEPYTNCVDSASIGGVYDGNSTLRYSQSACVAICTEKKIRDKCKCQETQYMDILMSFNTNETRGVPLCEDLNLDLKDLLENFRCLDRHHRTVERECGDICPEPCKDVVFNINPSRSRWPERESMPQFYEQILKNKIYKNRFPPVEQVKEDVFHDMVKRQYMKLSVYHGNPLIIEYNDTPTITISNFLSRLGGALNLWSGITVIVFMEILDVLYRIIWSSVDHCCSRGS